MKYFIFSIFFFSGIQVFCQYNLDYVKNLPAGFSFKNGDGEEGQYCNNDFDLDGKSDLIIELFSSESDSEYPGMIAVFLSSKFEIDKSYQWFYWLWSGRSLNLDCDKNIAVSGGIESQGVFQDLQLVYSQSEKKVIVKSYEDNTGKTAFKINMSK